MKVIKKNSNAVAVNAHITLTGNDARLLEPIFKKFNLQEEEEQQDSIAVAITPRELKILNKFWSLINATWSDCVSNLDPDYFNPGDAYKELLDKKNVQVPSDKCDIFMDFATPLAAQTGIIINGGAISADGKIQTYYIG